MSPVSPVGDRRTPRTDAEVQAALADVDDHAIVFHGFATHLRDYDVHVVVTAAPSTGLAPEYLRYRFTHCVAATVTTAVPPGVWARSLDDRLLDAALADGLGLDGYVWGVEYQVNHPGMRLVGDSETAARWTRELGLRFREVLVETNGHDLRLVFADLVVEALEPGTAPFVVGR